MKSRPLSQLTISELQSLQRLLQKSSVESVGDRFQIDRIARSLNLPKLGDQVQTDRLSEKARCENSFAEFVRVGFEELEPGTVFLGNWHIDAYCNHLEAMLFGRIEHLIVNIPPGCMKSLLTSVFWPAFVWLHDPTQRFMFASYDQPLSTRDSLRCRSLIQSDWYQGHWSDRFYLTGDQNEKTKFQNSKTGWRIATSTKGRGMGEHPHWLMIDDPNNTSKTASAAEREYVNEQWWDGAMSSRGRRLEGHHRVIVQQRVSPSDLTGHVLKKHGGDETVLLEPGEWQHLRLPMRFEPENKCTTAIFEDPRTEVDELLWPDAFSELIVEQIARDMTPIVAAGQLQQRPTVKGGDIFHSEWMQPVENAGLVNEWLQQILAE